VSAALARTPVQPAALCPSRRPGRICADARRVCEAKQGLTAEPAIKRYVIIGFDNAQQAKAWYDSADMKNINTYNDQHTKGRAFLVDAVSQ
jgi:hypothetical protein